MVTRMLNIECSDGTFYSVFCLEANVLERYSYLPYTTAPVPNWAFNDRVIGYRAAGFVFHGESDFEERFSD